MILNNKTRVLLILIIVFLIHYSRLGENFTQDNDPSIYILTRTSGRPSFFKKCRESLKLQSYKNWFHLISTDDEKSYEYASQDNVQAKVIKVQKRTKDKINNCPYNLYLNELIDHVPLGGWIIFLDDDGKMLKADSLDNLAAAIKRAEKEKKGMVLSRITYGPNNKILRGSCWEKSMKEFRDLIKKDWWSCRIDTAMMAIKKTADMQKWESKCAGDVRFLNNNIQFSGYEIYYNKSEPIISANYFGQGKGTRKDLT